ncbi:MAG: hypothetical protein ACKOPG_01410 [Novosphingobium sp.]
MATLAENPGGDPVSSEQRERRFFMGMAIAIAVAVALGFGAYAVLGISSFGAPWWVHVHAFTFVGWIALYLNQNRLIVRGEVAQHRRMGRLMAAWAVWMTVVGFSTLVLNTATHRTPPIFTPVFIMTLDALNLVLFLMLLAGGLALRRQTDWHRRLMLSATVCLIAPALGRIAVVSGGFSLIKIAAMQLAFIAVAMVRDWRVLGRIHPAYCWGAAAILALAVLVGPLAGLAPVAVLSDAIAAK